jgi:hypothetical protein
MQSEQPEKIKRQFNLRSFGYWLINQVFSRVGSFIVKMAIPV